MQYHEYSDHYQPCVGRLIEGQKCLAVIFITKQYWKMFKKILSLEAIKVIQPQKANFLLPKPTAIIHRC